jgi:hypothetical protein
MSGRSVCALAVLVGGAGAVVEVAGARPALH